MIYRMTTTTVVKGADTGPLVRLYDEAQAEHALARARAIRDHEAAERAANRTTYTRLVAFERLDGEFADATEELS